MGFIPVLPALILVGTDWMAAKTLFCLLWRASTHPDAIFMLEWYGTDGIILSWQYFNPCIKTFTFIDDVSPKPMKVFTIIFDI